MVIWVDCFSACSRARLYKQLEAATCPLKGLKSPLNKLRRDRRDSTSQCQERPLPLLKSGEGLDALVAARNQALRSLEAGHDMIVTENAHESWLRSSHLRETILPISPNNDPRFPTLLAIRKRRTTYDGSRQLSVDRHTNRCIGKL